MLTKTHKKQLITEKRELTPDEIPTLQTRQPNTKSTPTNCTNRYLNDAPNPYITSVNGTTVNINFSDSGKPINELRIPCHL